MGRPYLLNYLIGAAALLECRINTARNEMMTDDSFKVTASEYRQLKMARIHVRAAMDSINELMEQYEDERRTTDNNVRST